MQTRIHKTSFPSFSGALILAVLMQLSVSRTIVSSFPRICNATQKIAASLSSYQLIIIKSTAKLPWCQYKFTVNKIVPRQAIDNVGSLLHVDSMLQLNTTGEEREITFDLSLYFLDCEMKGRHQSIIFVTNTSSVRSMMNITIKFNSIGNYGNYVCAVATRLLE